MTRRKSDWTIIMLGYIDGKEVHNVQLGTLETKTFPFGIPMKGEFETYEDAVVYADEIDSYMQAFARRKK